MSFTDAIALDLSKLRSLCVGDVLGPEDAGWDDARRAFNLTLDQRPAAVVLALEVSDVVAAVRFARDHGLQVAPQTTGHNAAPLASLEETLLVKTTEMKGVEIDAAARRARVRAGARWGDVVPAASELGLAALHGSSPDVGIVGYSLGGGMGWYARKHGLAANHVTAIELVTADGKLVRTDAETKPELFWALRGGSGNFGVVTAIEFELFPVAEVYAGALFFEFERASEVLQAWREWAADAPEEVTSVGRVLQFPPLPEVPEPVRGSSFAVIEAAYLGDEAAGSELMRPLRELGPAMDTFALVPPVGLSELHMDPREPVPAVSGHLLVSELPASALDELLAVVGPGSGSPLVSVELRHTGGALARASEGHGARASLPGSYAMFAVGVAMDDGIASLSRSFIERTTAALEPWRTGLYPNFVEEPADAGELYEERTLERLRAVKEAYDPGHVFRANHPITAAE